MSPESYLWTKLQTVVPRRRMLQAAGEAALGVAAIATVGCDSEGPPDFTIHTDGYTDRLRAIPEMFGDTPTTQVLLRKVPSSETLLVGQATFKRDRYISLHDPLHPRPYTKDQGTLQILLPEIYKERKSAELRLAVITVNYRELIIEDVRRKQAKDASFSNQVYAEDQKNEAFEIKLKEKIIGKDLWELISGSVIYIQEVNPKTKAPITGSRRKIRILPSPF